jgi:hypothetical protein
MNNELRVTGKLIQINEIQSGVSKAGKEWKKQSFVIETQDQFPKKIAFDLFGDKLSLLDGIGQGQQLEVSFNLESREYNGRWFHNVNAWKVQPIQNNQPETSVDNNQSNDMPPEPGNDLPF